MFYIHFTNKSQPEISSISKVESATLDPRAPSGDLVILCCFPAHGLDRVDCRGGIHHAPALLIDAHVRYPNGRLYESELDLLRSEIRNDFEHLRRYRRDYGRRKAGPVHVLVMAADDAVISDLDPYDLAQQVGSEVRRLV